MKKVKNTFEKIGYISVDAGIVQIEDSKLWLDYIEDTGIDKMQNGSLSIPHETKMEGKAIVVQSGFGDGIYPVLAKRCKKTGLIKEVKIKFF